MPSKLVVCDAGPLIALARIHQLELLPQLFEAVFLTDKVQEECLYDLSLPGAQEIQQAIQKKYLQVHVIEEFSLKEGLLNSLDEGEKTALLLASHLKATLLIDEKRGRHIARSLSIKILGTAGLFLRAYQKGLIQNVESCLTSLKQQGYRLSDRLIEATLQQAVSIDLSKKIALQNK